jgi:hypothetical protein
LLVGVSAGPEAEARVEGLTPGERCTIRTHLHVPAVLEPLPDLEDHGAEHRERDDGDRRTDDDATALTGDAGEVRAAAGYGHVEVPGARRVFWLVSCSRRIVAEPVIVVLAPRFMKGNQWYVVDTVTLTGSPTACEDASG